MVSLWPLTSKFKTRKGNRVYNKEEVGKRGGDSSAAAHSPLFFFMITRTTSPWISSSSLGHAAAIATTTTSFTTGRCGPQPRPTFSPRPPFGILTNFFRTPPPRSKRKKESDSFMKNSMILRNVRVRWVLILLEMTSLVSYHDSIINIERVKVKVPALDGWDDYLRMR